MKIFHRLLIISYWSETVKIWLWETNNQIVLPLKGICKLWNMTASLKVPWLQSQMTPSRDGGWRLNIAGASNRHISICREEQQDLSVVMKDKGKSKSAPRLYWLHIFPPMRQLWCSDLWNKCRAGVYQNNQSTEHFQFRLLPTINHGTERGDEGTCRSSNEPL